MKHERRLAQRRQIEPLEVSSITTLDSLATIARNAVIVEASTTGLLMHVSRTDLVPRYLRDSLTLEAIEGDRVIIHIRQMNLEISGYVSRTKLLGKRGFEIAIDYSSDAPEYWRECLLDLLPAPGEFD